MNDKQKEIMLDWLRSAHGMELSLIENLEEKSKDAESAAKPEIKQRIDEHIVETKRHASDLETCIKGLGGDVSGTKDMVGKMMGYIQGAMKSMFKDVMVKNAIESHAAEHFEMAVYMSLIEAANAVGEREIADVCKRILDDENRMAEWTNTIIPTATKEFLMSQLS